jgi:hypothetical protein
LSSRDLKPSWREVNHKNRHPRKLLEDPLARISPIQRNVAAEFAQSVAFKNRPPPPDTARSSRHPGRYRIEIDVSSFSGLLILPLLGRFS